MLVTLNSHKNHKELGYVHWINHDHWDRFSISNGYIKVQVLANTNGGLDVSDPEDPNCMAIVRALGYGTIGYVTHGAMIQNGGYPETYMNIYCTAWLRELPTTNSKKLMLLVKKSMVQVID